MPSLEVISFDLSKQLSLNFYQNDVLEVAKQLLGKALIKREKGQILAAKIVEVEAYRGKSDQAAHSYRGKTKRNEVMFKSGGFLYVYFIYGIHYCANVVTGKENDGDAILLRAAEPLLGVDIMRRNRYGATEGTAKQIDNLTNGPAKLAKAFKLNGEYNGVNLASGDIFFIEFEEIEKNDICTSKRIGISKSKDLPWRFFIKNNRFLSK